MSMTSNGQDPVSRQRSRDREDARYKARVKRTGGGGATGGRGGCMIFIVILSIATLSVPVVLAWAFI